MACVLKPGYAEFCRLAHSAGKFVFCHSDGNISAIYPDLIEIGVDALNSQLFCMDLEELGRLYRASSLSGASWIANALCPSARRKMCARMCAG